MDPRKFLVSGRKFLFGCKFCFVRKAPWGYNLDFEVSWFNGFSARVYVSALSSHT